MNSLSWQVMFDRWRLRKHSANVTAQNFLIYDTDGVANYLHPVVGFITVYVRATRPYYSYVRRSWVVDVIALNGKPFVPGEDGCSTELATIPINDFTPQKIEPDTIHIIKK